MSDLEHDGYTQRALAVADLAIAHEKIESPEMRARLLRAADALIFHMNHPKGEVHLLPSPEAKEKTQ